MLAEVLILLLTIIIGYYWYAYKSAHHYFELKGVKYLKGVPIFGNMMNYMLRKMHLWENCDEIYKTFPGERYVGLIDGTGPVILIRDPELIKQIAVKDFDHFLNHKEFFPEEEESILRNSLLMLKDEKWREMRAALSPAFTGSKMREMLPFMTEISHNIVDYLKGIPAYGQPDGKWLPSLMDAGNGRGTTTPMPTEYNSHQSSYKKRHVIALGKYCRGKFVPQSNKHPSEETDVDDLMSRYANDVIASAAFGLQVNSLKEKDNAFFKTGQDMLSFNLSQTIRMLFSSQFPSLSKKLGVTIISKSTSQFFRNLITNTIDYRIKNKVERPDMIQLLMQLSSGTFKHNETDVKEKNVGFASTEEEVEMKKNLRKWTENELAAQLFIFFFAGFETTGNTLVDCIHELALNPHVQDILYEEMKAFKETKGDLGYEDIGELKYLDCVVNETMRKWSASIFQDRCCTKAYVLPPPREGGQPCQIKPGEIIYNSVNSIHWDPKYFEDPEKFKPERFSDENKDKIKPFTFMPFGVGPRNCIGSRFALIEMKILLFHLVLNFKILKCKKTLDPIRMEPKGFNMKMWGGSWVKFEARE